VSDYLAKLFTGQRITAVSNLESGVSAIGRRAIAAAANLASIAQASTTVRLRAAVKVLKPPKHPQEGLLSLILDNTVDVGSLGLGNLAYYFRCAPAPVLRTFHFPLFPWFRVTMPC
jgi:hypothetical protein